MALTWPTFAVAKTRKASWRFSDPWTAAGYAAAACAAAWLVARLFRCGESSGGVDERRHVAAKRTAYYEEQREERRQRETQQHRAKLARAVRSPARPTQAESLVSPARHVPAEPAVSRTLHRRESLQIRDGGYGWQSALALFDTGNEGLTVVDAAFARRHAIFGSGGVFAQAERWVTLRGVVPGAEVRAPVVSIELRVHGHTFAVQAAVSELDPRTEVLVGVDVIERLWEAGFRIQR